MRDALNSPLAVDRQRSFMQKSQSSRSNLARDIMTEIDNINALIVEEEWHNIPAPIRKTCEGIIAFQELLGSKIVANSHTIESKVQIVEGRMK